MAQMGRPGLSASQKRELWQRWKHGQSLSDIARALEKHPGSIHGVVSSNGGIVPLERRRSRLALSPLEREEISRGIAADRSMRKIASSIQRAPSTVSREIARNGGRKRYRASEADQGAWGRARRPGKPCRLALSRRLQRIVAKKLSLEWSPEQISGWLKRSYPEDEEMQISHETIYRSLFVQARGVLKKELVGHLRTRRMMRRSKKASTRGQPREADCRRGFHPRSACRDRGPRSPGPLGGRPPGRLEQHAHCDAGRAEVALHDAGEGRRQGHGERRPGTEETGSAAACRAPEIADLGPRDGDGRDPVLRSRARRGPGQDARRDPASSSTLALDERSPAIPAKPMSNAGPE